METRVDSSCCLVAPSKEVRRHILARFKEIKDGIDHESTESSTMSVHRTLLRPRERRTPGLNDGLVRPGDTFQPGLSLAAAARAERPKLRGTINVIVVLVDFSDKTFAATQTATHYEKLWFDVGSNSVRDYYRDVSNNAVDIVGQVVGPFRMPNTIKYYANYENGLGDAAPNARTLARDAAKLADAKVDFTKYDNDGDGFVDAFVVVHAGQGAERTGQANDIWSHKWVLDGGAYQADGTQIYSYLTVPATCKLGVCAHELGHLAFGWPDLYDADYTSAGIGDWCLMAAGSYNGNEDNPAEPCAWCKVDQGWVDVVTPADTEQVSLADVKDDYKVLKLWKDGAPETEYFLVENRQLKGRDADLPAGGLLLWHIDDTKNDNTNENSSYKVALVQSDGRRDLERRQDQGDAGDPFPGVKNVKSIDSSTNPSTKANNGAATGVALTNISDSGPVMTFIVSVSSGGGTSANDDDILDMSISEPAHVYAHTSLGTASA